MKMMTPNADNKEELGHKIQRRILSDTRQTLQETQEALRISEMQVDTLAKEILHKHEDMNHKIAMAEEKIALMDEKEAMIAMLKQRVKNVSEEYNRQCNGKRAMLPPDKRATTLEDIYKLTGELDQEGSDLIRSPKI
jgi:small-conductance mechanosensitive channel